MVKFVRKEHSEDGVTSDNPVFGVYTDGGPDHRTTYGSVQLSYIAMFILLGFDILVAGRMPQWAAMPTWLSV